LLQFGAASDAWTRHFSSTQTQRHTAQRLALM
jgi:hypothetical protein